MTRTIHVTVLPPRLVEPDPLPVLGGPGPTTEVEVGVWFDPPVEYPDPEVRRLGALAAEVLSRLVYEELYHPQLREMRVEFDLEVP